MKMLVFHWMSNTEALIGHGVCHNEMHDVSLEQILELSEHFDIMITDREAGKILYLDDKGKLFRQR